MVSTWRTGAGNDILVGNDIANVLIGQAGNDTLSGWGGDNRLVGGVGTDLLRGGLGDNAADIFVFNALTDSTVGADRDTVQDFVSGTDRFDVQGIDTNANAAGDQSFLFGGATAPRPMPSGTWRPQAESWSGAT